MRYSSCREIILSLAIQRGLGAVGSQRQAPGSGALQGWNDNTALSRPTHAGASSNSSTKETLICSQGPVCPKQQLGLRQTSAFPSTVAAEEPQALEEPGEDGPPPSPRQRDRRSRGPLGSGKRAPRRPPRERQATELVTPQQRSTTVTEASPRPPGAPPRRAGRRRPGPAEARGQPPSCRHAGFGQDRAELHHSRGHGAMFGLVLKTAPVTQRCGRPC